MRNIIKPEQAEDKEANNPNDSGRKDDVNAQTGKPTTNKKRGCTHYVKKWMKLTWNKKKIYLSILPHLFDQATDYGVILTYYGYIGDEDIEKNVSVIYWFYLSIFIIILHRIASTLGVLMITRNWFNVLLQTVDLLMIRCVWTSYKLNRDEPSTVQRYLGLLEATFEGMFH